jgi:hypothetical protein
VAKTRKIEPAGNSDRRDAERGRFMATKLTPKKSVSEKPATKEAPANGPAAAAKPGPAPEAKKARRSRKGTTVNAETAQVLRDAEAGKNLLHYPSLEAMFEDLGI